MTVLLPPELPPRPTTRLEPAFELPFWTRFSLIFLSFPCLGIGAFLFYLIWPTLLPDGTYDSVPAPVSASAAKYLRYEAVGGLLAFSIVFSLHLALAGKWHSRPWARWAAVVVGLFYSVAGTALIVAQAVDPSVTYLPGATVEHHISYAGIGFALASIPLVALIKKPVRR